MRRIERSAIVPFPAATMFDLVADVRSYPQFLPGCTGVRIHAESSEVVSASMLLSRGPLQLELRTRNTMERPDRIRMALEQGPFSALDGGWIFVPIGAAGCRVGLQLEFAFSSRLADALLGPVFESLAGELVNAFAKRAAAIAPPSPGAVGQEV